MTNPAALAMSSRQVALGRFETYQKLAVRQRKRWLEILFSWEAKNQYEVYDEHQTPVLHVAEDGTGLLNLLKRLFLGPIRPFSATVTDLATGQPSLLLRRPFRFIFHRLEVRAPDGQLLGAIQKKWSWVRRIYSIQDAEGRSVAEIFGPMLKPWTFELRSGGRVVGMITKKWSGLGKELFTDADNFGVDLGQMEPGLKALAFSATVLVDVVHFERSKG